jgi:hypothetical protein
MKSGYMQSDRIAIIIPLFQQAMEFNLIQFCATEPFPGRLFFTYSSEQTLNRIIEPVYRATLLGLPATWTVIVAWLTASPPKEISPPPPPPTLSKKCPEIPVLPSYSIPPPPSFWSVFPSAAIPQQVFTPVDVFRFQNLYNQLRSTWTIHQQSVGDSALHSLLQGALPNFQQHLPPISVSNTSTAIRYGEWVTDTIASWINPLPDGPLAPPPLTDGPRSDWT